MWLLFLSFSCHICWFSELESMTTAKRNPVITVPLSKGGQSMRNNSNRDDAQFQASAPPVPTRIGKCLVQLQLNFTILSRVSYH